MARCPKRTAPRVGSYSLAYWLEGVLWLLGISLLVIVATQWVRQSVAADINTHEFLRRASSASLQIDPPDTSLWSAARIQHFNATSGILGTPIGVLSIDRLNLAAPIYPGTSETTLNHGIGWLDKTANLNAIGNTALAAHRDSFFRVLKDVEVGDAIQLTTLKGQQTYRVQSLQVVEPDDVSVLAPTNHSQITLITCYPFYFVGSAPQRFIVTATADSLAQLH